MITAGIVAAGLIKYIQIPVFESWALSLSDKMTPLKQAPSSIRLHQSKTPHGQGGEGKALARRHFLILTKTGWRVAVWLWKGPVGIEWNGVEWKVK